MKQTDKLFIVTKNELAGLIAVFTQKLLGNEDLTKIKKDKKQILTILKKKEYLIYKPIFESEQINPLEKLVYMCKIGKVDLEIDMEEKEKE